MLREVGALAEGLPHSRSPPCRPDAEQSGPAAAGLPTLVAPPASLRWTGRPVGVGARGGGFFRVSPGAACVLRPYFTSVCFLLDALPETQSRCENAHVSAPTRTEAGILSGRLRPQTKAPVLPGTCADASCHAPLTETLPVEVLPLHHSALCPLLRQEGCVGLGNGNAQPDQVLVGLRHHGRVQFSLSWV